MVERMDVFLGAVEQAIPFEFFALSIYTTYPVSIGSWATVLIPLAIIKNSNNMILYIVGKLLVMYENVIGSQYNYTPYHLRTARV